MSQSKPDLSLCPHCAATLAVLLGCSDDAVATVLMARLDALETCAKMLMVPISDVPKAVDELRMGPHGRMFRDLKDEVKRHQVRYRSMRVRRMKEPPTTP